MTDPAAPTTPQNHNAETWGGLVNAIQRFARTRSDLDWPAVEQAMRDRDAFHRAAIEAEARSTPAEALQEALALIEQVDQRCLAADGPVSRIQAEMTDVEWRRLYILIKSAARTESDR